jgi:5-methylcytosine-specific restriction endonuclease McrA
MLPPRLTKKPKRATRWRSQAHATFVRSHACSACLSTAAIEFAHVRLGSGAGMGQKPDDWHAVSLCRDCHVGQHSTGEATFWKGRDVEALICAFIADSPKRRDIEQAMRERANG